MRHFTIRSTNINQNVLLISMHNSNQLPVNQEMICHMEKATQINKNISLLLNIFVGVRLVYASPQTETSVKSQRLIVETFGTWNFIEQGCRNPILKTCYPAESSILQTGGKWFSPR